MNISVIGALLIIAAFIAAFGGGFALCLICKQIAWEVRFHKTTKKLRDLFNEDETKSLDWINGARWALTELIKKGD